ncbi:MAG TPA: hypothetical protein VFM46_02410 [Pseudomonadales bacterium]|nr:hypothetical protein [Pseudomonadales bacterium]
MPAIATAETVRQLTPGSNALFAKTGRRWIERWREQRMGKKAAEFQPVTALARDEQAI